MKIRRGAVKEATVRLVEELDGEIIGVEALLSNLKSERTMLQRKLDQDE